LAFLIFLFAESWVAPEIMAFGNFFPLDRIENWGGLSNLIKGLHIQMEENSGEGQMHNMR
jgi:hypothetical protein